MSKKTTSAVVLVALLAAMGAGAFIGSQAGGGSSTMAERTTIGATPALVLSPSSSAPDAPPAATPSSIVSSLVTVAATPLIEGSGALMPTLKASTSSPHRYRGPTNRLLVMGRVFSPHRRACTNASPPTPGCTVVATSRWRVTGHDEV